MVYGQAIYKVQISKERKLEEEEEERENVSDITKDMLYLLPSLHLLETSSDMKIHQTLNELALALAIKDKLHLNETSKA